VDEAGKQELVLSHSYEARDREVLIQFPVGTIGDTLGWFPYAARFAAVRSAKVTCSMSGLLIPLFREAYPHIRFVTHEEAVEQNVAAQGFYRALGGRCVEKAVVSPPGGVAGRLHGTPHKLRFVWP